MDMVKLVADMKEAVCINSNSCAMLVNTMQANKNALAKTLKNNKKDRR